MRNIKKEMTMIKGGEFLEWYDSLDAVEKAQYKVEFNKLQEDHNAPLNVILNNSKNRFEEDLVQSRFEAAIKEVYEWTIDDLHQNIQEAMSDYDLIPFLEDGDINWDKLDNDFHKIYIDVVRKLYTDAIHRKPDNLNTTEAG